MTGARPSFEAEGPICLSTKTRPQVVTDYIADELQLGRMAEVGSVEKLGIQVSPFRLIPKKGRPNKFRLILDLSAPEGHSVNDGISKDTSSLKYVSVDQVVEAILSLGRGTLMAKLDTKQAYRCTSAPQRQNLAWHGMGMEVVC